MVERALDRRLVMGSTPFTATKFRGASGGGLPTSLPNWRRKATEFDSPAPLHFKLLG